jgi:hypothetical protein
VALAGLSVLPSHQQRLVAQRRREQLMTTSRRSLITL